MRCARAMKALKLWKSLYRLFGYIVLHARYEGVEALCSLRQSAFGSS